MTMAAADRYEQGLAILLPLFGENHPATLKYSRGQLVSLEALDRADEAAVVEARITRSEATEVAEDAEDAEE